MYTIYGHPSDHPDHFVVRGSTVQPGAGPNRQGSTIVQDTDCQLADTLEAARELIPDEGLYCLERLPEDDPVILEVWF